MLSRFTASLLIFHYLNLLNSTYFRSKTIFSPCACIVNTKFSAEFSAPWLCLLLGFSATCLASRIGGCSSQSLHCVTLLPGALVPHVLVALTNTISRKNLKPDFLLAPSGTRGLPYYSITTKSKGSLPVLEQLYLNMINITQNSLVPNIQSSNLQYICQPGQLPLLLGVRLSSSQ